MCIRDSPEAALINPPHLAALEGKGGPPKPQKAQQGARSERQRGRHPEEPQRGQNLPRESRSAGSRRLIKIVQPVRRPLRLCPGSRPERGGGKSPRAVCRKTPETHRAAHRQKRDRQKRQKHQPKIVLHAAGQHPEEEPPGRQK